MLKPVLPLLTRSQLFAVMTGGFASVAGTLRADAPTHTSTQNYQPPSPHGAALLTNPNGPHHPISSGRAGGVLAAYISFGISPGALLAACFMSAPAAISVAKLMVPDHDGECGSCVPILLTARATHPDSAATYRRAHEAQRTAASPTRKVVSVELGAISRDLGEISPELPSSDASGGTSASGGHRAASNGNGGGAEHESDGLMHARRVRMPRSSAGSLVEAAADGASTAAPMVQAIVTMLIAFVSLVHLVNSCVRWLASLVHWSTNATELLGWGFWPVALLIGTPAHDCHLVGQVRARGSTAVTLPSRRLLHTPLRRPRLLLRRSTTPLLARRHTVPRHEARRQ